MYSQDSPKMFVDAVCGPEHLVICVDSTCRFPELKSRIKHFLELKCLVNQHEIALMVIKSNGEVKWLRDFTRDTRSVVTSLEEFQKGDHRYRNHHNNVIDISQVFEQLQSQWENRSCNIITSLRLIMFYSTTSSIPQLINPSAWEKLINNPSFTIDIVYVLQLNRKSYDREREFAKLVEENLLLLSNDRSYVFPLSPENLTSLTVRLLAHPLLRGPMKQTWHMLGDSKLA